MKKLLVLLLSCLSISSVTVYAQKKMRIGIKAGMNIASLIEKPRPKNQISSPIIGFNAGIFAEIVASQQITFVPELLISTQGFKVKEGSNSRSTYRVDITYLNIPLIVRFKSNKKWNFDLGLQPGIGLNSSLSATFRDFNEEVSVDGFGHDGALQRFDFSLIAGVSYHINNKIPLQLRFVPGVSNIFNTDNKDVAKNRAQIRNSVFQLSVGYLF